MTLHHPRTAMTVTPVDAWAMAVARPALRRGAVYEAATAIITATHGPRPTITGFGWSASRHSAAEATRIAAGMVVSMESMSDAFAWDRRVSNLTRAIVAETRVLS